ncbi:hypothetical protein LCGC14_2824700, partial [marine sediment metagenome]
MKNSFLLYHDQMNIIDKLTDEQAGQLLKAIVKYSSTGELIELDFGVEMAFFGIKNHLDRDNEKYLKIVETRTQLGKKGGLAKASKSKQKLAKASKSQVCLANVADSVSVSVSVSDSVNDIKKDICEVFDFWKATMNHPKAKLDDKRRQKIKKALGLGYSKEELMDAVRGCVMTAHNMGDNDRYEIFDDIELILRNSSNIERFINNSKGKVEFVKKSK